MPIAATRCYHVNVNCSDLARSLAWYTSVLGLSPAVRTEPAEGQPGTGFGLDVAQWDAWILQGVRGHDGIVLDLLQWLVPLPVGRPRTLGDSGFTALVVTAPTVPDSAVPTPLIDGGRVVTDPDGTPVIVMPGEPAIDGLVVGCADIAASRRWYHQVVGLTLDHDGNPVDPDRGFTLRLVEADRSRPAAIANELGIFRTALFTSDIDGDHEVLLAAGTPCFSPPVDLVMGPGLPSLRALFFADPDGACVELIDVPAH